MTVYSSTSLLYPVFEMSSNSSNDTLPGKDNQASWAFLQLVMHCRVF